MPSSREENVEGFESSRTYHYPSTNKTLGVLLFKIFGEIGNLLSLSWDGKVKGTKKEPLLHLDVYDDPLSFNFRYPSCLYSMGRPIFL